MASTPHTPENVPAPEDPGRENLPAPGDPPGPVTSAGSGTAEPVRPAPVDTDIDEGPRVTRAGMIWTATVAGLILLVLLIIFIAQNQDQVTLRYFGFEGPVNLGLALFIAAVSGGLLTAVAGATRIIQLRARAHRSRKGRNRNRSR